MPTRPVGIGDMDGRAGLPFKVLLIGGPSGAGKSAVGAMLGRQLGIPWLQVDDLRLALQFSGLVSHEQHPDLFSFLGREEWHLSPEEFRDKLIVVGRIISGALRIIVESHVHKEASSIIIEGDGILPEFATEVRRAFGTGDVRAVFIIENDAAVLKANMLARGRGIDPHARDELRTESRAKALYSQWLQQEAHHYGLATIAPLPWETLPERVIAACSD